MILVTTLAAALQRIPQRMRLWIYVTLAAAGAALVVLGKMTEAEVDGALEVLAELLGIGALVMAASNTPKADA